MPGADQTAPPLAINREHHVDADPLYAVSIAPDITCIYNLSRHARGAEKPAPDLESP
jgi:hypothetical protein